MHFHGRRADDAPDNAPESCLETIRLVRAACPILIHPSLGYVANDADAPTRLAAVERAMERPKTRVHLAPMDAGSINVDRWDPGRRTYTTTGLVYRNSTATLPHFAERIRRHRLNPYLVSWNVSFTRQIDTLLRMGAVGEPAFVCFCLTDGTMLPGHPGTEAGLDAHLAFLPGGRRIVWTVVNYKGDLLRLLDKILAQGGHVPIGTGDYPYPELGLPTNAELIAHVARRARAMGREPASPEEARAILSMAA